METFFPEGPKRELLMAALELVVDSWPSKFTMAEIARKANTSKPRLAYHFKSTDEIMIELMKAWALSGQTVTQDFLSTKIGAPPMELILAIVDATFAWKKKYPLFARLGPCLIHLAHSHTQIGVMQHQTMSVGLQRVHDILMHDEKFKNLAAKKRQELAQGVHLTLIGGFLYSLATKTDEPSFVLSIKASIQHQIEKGIN